MGFDDKKDHPPQTPTEPGFYWARTSGFGWWNLIVQIVGESPYLHYRGWRRTDDQLFEGKSPTSLYFGPRIPDPPDPDIFYKELAAGESRD